jgi:hypothetical protein
MMKIISIERLPSSEKYRTRFPSLKQKEVGSMGYKISRVFRRYFTFLALATQCRDVRSNVRNELCKLAFDGSTQPIAPDAVLKAAYKNIELRLRNERPGMFIITDFERELARKIKEQTSVRFEQAKLIGNFTSDLFFIGIGERSRPDLNWDFDILSPIGSDKDSPLVGRFSGLGIELDGFYHNEPVKMKQDKWKYDSLQILGISIASIDNPDISSPTVRSIINDIKKMPPLCSKTRDLLRRKIYLFTIAHHAKPDMIHRLFGITESKVRHLEKILPLPDWLGDTLGITKGGSL